jgi:hypothetical protein
MGTIKTCVYDNPNTMAREAWMNGRLLCHVTAEFLELAVIPTRFVIDMRLNVGRWKEGQKLGDPEAIGEDHG